MAVFTTKEIEQRPHQVSDHLYATDDTPVSVICKGPEKLQKLLQLITGHSSVHYVSDGDWSMHDLTMELLKRYAPAELFITTYALRELSVRQIILAQQRKEIISANMLLDYRAKVQIPEVYQLASNNLNKINLVKIHAKVTVIRGAKGSVSIVGSANWTTNPRIECGVVSMDKGLADFHINWIQKIMENAEVFK